MVAWLYHWPFVPACRLLFRRAIIGSLTAGAAWLGKPIHGGVADHALAAGSWPATLVWQAYAWLVLKA